MATVFTNGVFDCLHAGHYQFLQFCRDLAGVGPLFVAIDTDGKAKKDKGVFRPYYTEDERRKMLFSLTSDGKLAEDDGPNYLVNVVPVFNDDDELLTLIRNINPDYIVKGSDWQDKHVIGHSVAPVIFAPTHSKHFFSTSQIAERILLAHENSSHR